MHPVCPSPVALARPRLSLFTCLSPQLGHEHRENVPFFLPPAQLLAHRIPATFLNDDLNPVRALRDLNPVGKLRPSLLDFPCICLRLPAWQGLSLCP